LRSLFQRSMHSKSIFLLVYLILFVLRLPYVTGGSVRACVADNWNGLLESPVAIPTPVIPGIP
jgi:hypothetical protein